MKILIAAAMLLALTPPVFAGHDQPTKKDVFDVFLTHIDCTRFDWLPDGYDPGESNPEQDKACKAFERATKKMKAQGYCVMGHIFIAREGNGGHCYNLKPKRDAQILQYIEQFEKEEPYVSIWKERCKKNPALSVCEANGWNNAR